MAILSDMLALGDLVKSILNITYLYTNTQYEAGIALFIWSLSVDWQWIRNIDNLRKRIFSVRLIILKNVCGKR